MLIKEKKEYFIKDLANFIEKYIDSEKFGEAIREYKTIVEQETGENFWYLVETGELFKYINSDEEEIEKILEKVEGNFLLEYDRESDMFKIAELDNNFEKFLLSIVSLINSDEKMWKKIYEVLTELDNNSVRNKFLDFVEDSITNGINEENNFILADLYDAISEVALKELEEILEKNMKKFEKKTGMSKEEIMEKFKEAKGYITIYIPGIVDTLEPDYGDIDILLDFLEEIKFNNIIEEKPKVLNYFLTTIENQLKRENEHLLC